MRTALLSDVGIKRDNNEDYIFFIDESIGSLKNLFILCDGMGGANAGEVASKDTVKYIVEYLEKSTDSIVSAMRESIKYANFNIYNDAKEYIDKNGMATTIVMATIYEDTLYVSNVGDSRLYLIEKDKINQITRDHCLAEELDNLDVKDYEKFKHILTRAVGAEEDIHIDNFEISLERDDKIMLCSDGLTNMLSDAQILEIVNKDDDIENTARKLIETANQNGGNDNISLILVSEILS